MAAALSPASAAATAGTSKRGCAFELLIARLDFIACQSAEAIHAEFFAAKTAHKAPVNHGAPQVGELNLAIGERDSLPRQITDESASEAVARARGVEHVL